jgi:hypothetical protein
VGSNAIDPPPSISRGDHIDDDRPLVEEPEERRSASVGDDGTATTSQGGGTKPSLVADPEAADGEDAAEDTVQPPVCCRPIDRGVAEADRSQLGPRDDAMLAISQNASFCRGVVGVFLAMR